MTLLSFDNGDHATLPPLPALNQMAVNSQIETAESAKPSAEAVPVERREVLISLNPRAGYRSCITRVEAIREMLLREGFVVRLTSDLQELTSIAAQSAADGQLRVVLAVGGDGTASVVRNHVPLHVPMLPVPMGTENLLGRYIAQSIRPEEVCRTVTEGVMVGLDMARANGKHFLLMISAGFDAEVVRVLHENRRGNISRGSYFIPTLRTILRYRYPRIRFIGAEHSTGSEPQSCRWVFAFNLPLYALGLPIAPDASASDGKLDVCTFERGNFFGVLRYLWHVQRRAHAALDDTIIMRTPSFRLEAEVDSVIPYQLDGDYGGTLPVDVDILPGDLRLLVSPKAAQKLGFSLPIRHPTAGE